MLEEKKTCDDREKLDNSWTPLMRQILVSSGVWPSYFIVGLCLGSPTVFVPQLRREANSTTVISDEMASWLSSTTLYSSVPWVFILPVGAHMFGRKIPMLCISLASLIGFIIFYSSTNLVHLFICEVLIGMSCGSQVSNSVFILTEYTSPRYRGIFLNIKSASLFWGIWIANIIGTFFHWRNIGIIGILCSLYAIFSIYFWPESPFWLASKSRFEECAKSHRWLKGSSADSEQELDRLLVESTAKKSNFREQYETFVSHKLYKSILVSSVVVALHTFSGKIVCSIYAIDIIKNMTSSESTAYSGMLILDGVTVLSMYVGCAMSKFVKRRTQLLVSSFIAAVSLLIFSLYLYLIRVMVLREISILLLGLLVIFSVFICIGPITLSTSISGELMPLKCRTFCGCMIALVANLLLATSVKCGPLVFKTFGFDGAFLFYAICISIFLTLSYIYLPETKDRTLQEIEDCFRSGSKIRDETKQFILVNK